jgi:hypothetical protein
VSVQALEERAKFQRFLSSFSIICQNLVTLESFSAL